MLIYNYILSLFRVRQPNMALTITTKVSSGQIRSSKTFYLTLVNSATLISWDLRCYSNKLECQNRSIGLIPEI